VQRLRKWGVTATRFDAERLLKISEDTILAERRSSGAT
jgi:hypothetical protein